MKKAYVVAVVFVSVFTVIAVAVAADRGVFSFKQGDSVYACNCGPACGCKSLSNNSGPCTCGTEMVKSSVVSASEETADLKAEGWNEPIAFPTKGKYVCACGPACNCNSISQNPGKCTCGTPMKPAE